MKRLKPAQPAKIWRPQVEHWGVSLRLSVLQSLDKESFLAKTRMCPKSPPSFK